MNDCKGNLIQVGDLAICNEGMLIGVVQEVVTSDNLNVCLEYSWEPGIGVIVTILLTVSGDRWITCCAKDHYMTYEDLIPEEGFEIISPCLVSGRASSAHRAPSP